MNGQKKRRVKRRTISLGTKISILDRLAKGEKPAALVKDFGLGESTIRSIQNRASELYKSFNCATKESATRASYTRNILVQKTEKALVIWIQELTQKRVPIDGESIKEKARRFFNQLKDSAPSSSQYHTGHPKFTASNGWLKGFLQRHALQNLKLKIDAASTDEMAAKNCSTELKKIIDLGGYTPDQVFNAHETGLLWKKMFSQTFFAKSEKSNFKAAKDRVTVLLCSNASGARMLKPLIISGHSRSSALKDKAIDKLPVNFMSNKKAQVTTDIFTTWFNDCFLPEVKKYMTDLGLPFKVLLIIGNAPGHPYLEHPNVKLVFLPPNLTRLLQPMDQGIIAVFKKHYIQLTFKYILDKLENDSMTLAGAWEEFSLLNCINNVAAAVSGIRQFILNLCWKSAWPDCLLNKYSTQNASYLISEITALAHKIGGEGFSNFSEVDINEMIQDEIVSDSDIINYVTDTTTDDEEEEFDLMTENNIYAGLQLWKKLENHFLAIDTNCERTSKFQKELRACMSVYSDIYTQLTNKPLSQKLITDFTASQKMSTYNECEEVILSSDESSHEITFVDFKPALHEEFDYEE